MKPLLAAVLSSALVVALPAFAQADAPPKESPPPAEQPKPAEPPKPADAPVADPAQPADPALTPAEQPAGTPAAETPPPAETPAPAEPPVEEVVGGKKKRTAEETITVTGSRIRRKDLTSQAPITVLSKEQFQQSGKASLGDFLQSLPEQGNTTNTMVNNAGTGATRVNLRGLGANRTLVLVNGRRWVPGGLGADDSVDLNSIPMAAIERIEVLKDGSSAIYGSDAISGVVNIITKKRFEGAEFNVFTGVSPRGDGVSYSVDGTGGVTSEKGSILASATYYQQYPVFAGNRPYASPQLFFDGSPGGGGYFPSGSSTTPPGRILSFGAGQTDPTASPLFNQLVTDNPTAGSFVRDPSAPLGWRPFLGAGLGAAGDGYDYQPINYLSTPQQRFQLYSSGDLNIGSNARAYFETAFAQRNSVQQLAPEPLVLDPGGSGILTSRDNIYNPFGKDVYVRRRLVEFGPRTFVQDVNNYRLVVGIDGSLPEKAGVLAGWTWDVNLNYSRFQGVQRSRGTLRTTKIAQAVGPSFYDADGNPRCGTPAAPIDGCVPLNLFGGEGSITPDQIAGVSFEGVQHIMNALTAVQANFGGELFRLFHTRPVGLAFGYEYRNQAGSSIPDPIQAAGENSGNNQDATAGSFYSNEGYVELNVPIVSDKPVLHELELTGAMRYAHYNTFGGALTGKVGGVWRPIQGLSLRGTWSNSFRAPSIADLYTGQADSFENVSDPCSGVNGPPPASCGAAANNGDVSTQLKAKIGGNTKLTPETASTITAGIVIEPGVIANIKAIRRLAFTVDYYRINIQNAIQVLGANTILAGCYPPASGMPISEYCGFISRDPGTQQVTRIDNFLYNAGSVQTDGIDFGMRYNVPTPVGEIGFTSSLSYLHMFDLTLGKGAGATTIRGAGNWDLNTSGYGGTYPHWRGLTSLTWGWQGVGAGILARYIGASRECGDPQGGGFYSGPGLCYQDNTYQRKIGEQLTFDIFLSYRFQWAAGKSQAMVGMNNVFDSAPPYIGNAFAANTDPMGGYDLMGRYVYFRLGHSF